MATTRKQMFLQKINDSNFSTPVPVTVEEQILDGMGGGGGESNIYMVPGDYMDGDTIDSEYLAIFNRLVYEIGGLGLIIIYVSATHRMELFAYANVYQYCITNPQVSAPTIGEDGTISFD